MTQAFVIHVEESDPFAGPSLAEDIRDACEAAGIPVVEVSPWARPSMAAPSSPLGGQAGLSSSPNPSGLTTP
jgi:hypothetical protein